jgi:hypothetical protein
MESAPAQGKYFNKNASLKSALSLAGALRNHLQFALTKVNGPAMPQLFWRPAPRQKSSKIIQKV